MIFPPTTLLDNTMMIILICENRRFFFKNNSLDLSLRFSIFGRLSGIQYHNCRSDINNARKGRDNKMYTITSLRVQGRRWKWLPPRTNRFPKRVDILRGWGWIADVDKYCDVVMRVWSRERESKRERKKEREIRFD